MSNSGEGNFDPFEGKGQEAPKATKPKSHGTTLALSVIISGTGHMYLGEWARGIAILIGVIIIAVVTNALEEYLGWAAYLIPILFWLWQIADAHKLYKNKDGKNGRP